MGKSDCLFLFIKENFCQKKIKENILDSVGLFSYLWQNFLSLLLWKLSQRWDENVEGIGEGGTPFHTSVFAYQEEN